MTIVPSYLVPYNSFEDSPARCVTNMLSLASLRFLHCLGSKSVHSCHLVTLMCCATAKSVTQRCCQVGNILDGSKHMFRPWSSFQHT